MFIFPSSHVTNDLLFQTDLRGSIVGVKRVVPIDLFKQPDYSDSSSVDDVTLCLKTETDECQKPASLHA